LCGGLSQIPTDSLSLSLNGWTILGGITLICDWSPQPPADGVTGLGGLTIQAHCLSGYSHSPPPQPPAQLLTQAVLVSQSLVVAVNYQAGSLLLRKSSPLLLRKSSPWLLRKPSPPPMGINGRNITHWSSCWCQCYT